MGELTPHNQQVGIISSDHERPYGILSKIVIRPQSAIFNITDQSIPIFKGIMNCFAQQTLGRGDILF